MTNGFISPMWGGVVVWNPPTCSSDSQSTHLNKREIPSKGVGLFVKAACSFNLLSCANTLEYLSKLVQSLPRMIVTEEIGKEVKFSLEAARAAQKNASMGIYDASAVSSREARALAEDAFGHPSIMSISYSSVEHCFAIYMPFFAPVSLHVLLAALKELRHFKMERTKYLASSACHLKTS